MKNQITILENERVLFHRLSRGEEPAFTKIFNYYEKPIFLFVLKLTKSKSIAEEVVQELFIKIWTAREKMATVENHHSYLFKMAANKSINYLKRMASQNRYTMAAALYSGGSHNNTEQFIDFRTTEKTISLSISKLTHQQKIVYQLSRHQGLSLNEISGKLNISKKTTKNHLTGALNRLKQCLKIDQPVKTIVLLLIADKLPALILLETLSQISPGM